MGVGVVIYLYTTSGWDKKSESVGEGFLKGAKLCNQVLSFGGIWVIRGFGRVDQKPENLKNEGCETTLWRFSRRRGDFEGGEWLYQRVGI